jgi:hypothetical protein
MPWDSTGIVNFTLSNSDNTATRSDSTNWNGRVSTVDAASQYTFTLDRSSGGDNFIVCLVNSAQTGTPSPPYSNTSQNMQFGVLIEGTLSGTGNLYKSTGSSWDAVETGIAMTNTTEYKFFKSGSTWSFSVDGSTKISGESDSSDWYLQSRNQNSDLSVTLASGTGASGTRLPPPPAFVRI